MQQRCRREFCGWQKCSPRPSQSPIGCQAGDDDADDDVADDDDNDDDDDEDDDEEDDDADGNDDGEDDDDDEDNECCPRPSHRVPFARNIICSDLQLYSNHCHHHWQLNITISQIANNLDEKDN